MGIGTRQRAWASSLRSPRDGQILSPAVGASGMLFASNVRKGALLGEGKRPRQFIMNTPIAWIILCSSAQFPHLWKLHLHLAQMSHSSLLPLLENHSLSLCGTRCSDSLSCTLASFLPPGPSLSTLSLALHSFSSFFLKRQCHPSSSPVPGVHISNFGSASWICPCGCLAIHSNPTSLKSDSPLLPSHTIVWPEQPDQWLQTTPKYSSLPHCLGSLGFP